MKVWRFIAVAVLFGALGAALTYVLTSRRLASGQRPTSQSQPEAGPLIVTSKVGSHSFIQQAPWAGVVQSRFSVQLIAPVAGRIEAIEVKDQTAVQAGTVVMRLGGARIETQRAPMQAGIDSFKSQLALAEQRVNRLSENLKDQLATRDQLTAAEEARLKLQGQLRDAELALKVFDAQLVIEGGTAGVFTNRQVSVGQTVEPGRIVGEVIDPNHLRIVASLLGDDGILPLFFSAGKPVPSVAEGMPAGRKAETASPRAVLKGKEATVRLSGNQVIHGSVRQVLPQMAPTGATEVWIEGPEIDRQLKPGQTVSGTVTLGKVASALAVPVSAVVYDAQERPYVFISKNGAYEKHSVTLGLMQDAWVQVLSGIKQGDSVVTQGAYELYYRQFSRQFKVED